MIENALTNPLLPQGGNSVANAGTDSAMDPLLALLFSSMLQPVQVNPNQTQAGLMDQPSTGDDGATGFPGPAPNSPWNPLGLDLFSQEPVAPPPNLAQAQYPVEATQSTAIDKLQAVNSTTIVDPITNLPPQSQISELFFRVQAVETWQYIAAEPVQGDVVASQQELGSGPLQRALLAEMVLSTQPVANAAGWQAAAQRPATPSISLNTPTSADSSAISILEEAPVTSPGHMLPKPQNPGGEPLIGTLASANVANQASAVASQANLVDHDQPLEPIADDRIQAGDGELADGLRLRESGSLMAERIYKGPNNLPPAIQISQVISQAINDKQSTLQVQLYPEELGGVDIELTMDAEKRVSVSIAVERPETLELLSREARQIERLLASHGLDLDNGLNLAMQNDGDQHHAENEQDAIMHQNDETQLGQSELPAGDPAPITQAGLTTTGVYDLTI